MSIIINGAGTITGVSATGITTAPTNATDATKLPLAGGTVIGNVIHTDNKKVLFGSDSDAEMYHTGSQLIIKDTSAEMKILATRVQFQNAGATENIASFNADGAVELYHNHSKKIETTSTGATVTGIATATSFAGSGANLTGIDAVTVSTSAPSSPTQGDLWFNSSANTISGIASKSLAVYNATAWKALQNDFSATGGTITTSGGYTIHTFTSSGTFTPSKGGTVDYLVVGGGGGSGGYGGGGGGGGFRTATGFTVTATGLTVTVGAGGAGSAYNGLVASNGGNSVFSSITSLGGGGGSARQHAGANGASGGGGNGGWGTAGGSGTSGQGNNGGTAVGNSTYFGGGGGGASAVGGNGTTTAGVGGAGTASSYSGSSVTYAGGGGGMTDTSSNGGAGGAGGGGKGFGFGDGAATGGTANTGGGGGAGGDAATGKTDGGSGIVIIRYLT